MLEYPVSSLPLRPLTRWSLETFVLYNFSKLILRQAAYLRNLIYEILWLTRNWNIACFFCKHGLNWDICTIHPIFSGKPCVQLVSLIFFCNFPGQIKHILLILFNIYGIFALIKIKQSFSFADIAIRRNADKNRSLIFLNKVKSTID